MTRRRIAWIVATLAFVVAVGSPQRAHAAWVLQHTLTDPTPAEPGIFGYSVGAVGTNWLVGEPGFPSPSAYVLDGTTAAPLLELKDQSPPFPQTSFYFGTSVAAYGDDVLVGDPSHDAVLLFDGATGALLRTIANPTPAPPDSTTGQPTESFGWSVATLGTNVLVGDPEDGRRGVGTGAAYLIDPFGSPTGALVSDLPNPSPSFRAAFGNRMAVLGSDILVGSRGNASDLADQHGLVHLISGTTNTVVRTFTVPLPVTSTNAEFGYDVAAAGGNVLIGARSEAKAYLFAPNGTLLATYVDPDTTPPRFNAFGTAVASIGTRVLVAAPYSGRVHVFDAATAALVQTIQVTTGANSMDLAVIGSRFIVGAAGLVRIYAPCGDGVVQTGETCDDGNEVSGDGCDENCTVTACGNGVVTTGEVCDDGNVAPGDGCRADCTVEACGDGTVDPQEECDDGDTTSGDGCDENCRPTGCGNGVLTGSEVCDDGNLQAGDGCRANCTVEACGDGTTDPQEQCDDGNTDDGDGCDSNCRPTGCGNAIVNVGEQCDDGNGAGGDCCSATCSYEAPGQACTRFGNPGTCNGGGVCVPAAIPTLSEWGVILLAGLMLLAMIGRRTAWAPQRRRRR